MIASISFFFISFIVIVVLITNKVYELENGRAFIVFHRNADNRLKNIANKVKIIAKSAPREIGRIALYFLIKKGVEVGEKIKTKIHPKIGHIVDAVKGRDLPKNKGKVSFFLTKISDDLDKKDR